MIRIAITEAAFQAIASTMPLGSVGYEAEVGANGERLIWLAPNLVDRLRALGPVLVQGVQLLAISEFMI